MNYSWLYGSSFSASSELQTMAAGWYQNGTEVIFACGGPMFDSISAAASAEDAKVIGVDVDQSSQSPTVITSAMKGIGEAAQQALKAAETEDSWKAFNGDGTQTIVLGAAEGAVGLPTATWSLSWPVSEYEAMFADIVAGKLTIDDADVPEPASTAHVTRASPIPRRSASHRSCFHTKSSAISFPNTAAGRSGDGQCSPSSAASWARLSRITPHCLG